MGNRPYIEPVPDHKSYTLADGVSMADDFFTEPFDTKDFHKGAIQFIWAGVTAFDSILILQGSINGINYNDMGNDTTDELIDVAAESGLFELKEITVPFYRLRYQANNNTTGTMTVKARGRGYI